MAASSATPTARPVDEHASARALARLGSHAAWLHGEVCRRMAQRLQLLRQQPQRVLDASAAPHALSAEALRSALPKARINAFGKPMAKGWLTRWLPQVQQAAGAEQEADLLWSNLQLHWEADPGQAMARWHRCLQVQGVLMFSTFGPSTLAELRQVYAAMGWGEVHTPFIDMHDLGDMLVRSGFADPVMDQEMLSLTWPSAQAMLAELRTLGVNTHPSRHAGLRTPRWYARLCGAINERLAQPDGRVALSFELVYGHAHRPQVRAQVAPHTEVPLAQMRSMLRRPRPGSGA